MINMTLKKIVVVGCIILFLGTTFNPIGSADQIERQSFVTKSPNLDNITYNVSAERNYMNFIYGEGYEVETIDLKMVIITQSIWDLVLLRLLFWEAFSILITKLMERPRFIIGYGYWDAFNGGNITTIGVNGVQKWTANERDDVGVWLMVFIGIIVPSKSPDEKGFICGFSLMSAPVEFHYQP